MIQEQTRLQCRWPTKMRPGRAGRFATFVQGASRALRRYGIVLLVALGVEACGLDPRGLARSANADAPANSHFHTVADLPLPGDTSRFDYQSYDPRAHRLYLAHLGAGVVLVVDTQKRAVVGTVPDVRGVHGVLVVPDLGRVYASATDRNEVAVIDATSLAVIASAPGGDYPDGLAYDPEVGKVYVSDESGQTDTVIDTRTNQRVATIPLGGEVGNTQYDPAIHRVYAAVQTRNQIVAIDPATDRVVERLDTPGCEEPHGLLIDPERHLAFAACQGNAKLAVLDMTTGQVTALHDVGDNPDVLAFDPGLRRLYVAAESGVLAVFDEDGNGPGLREVARGFAAANAHSVVVDPDTHHIYLPLQNLDGHPVLRELEVS